MLWKDRYELGVVLIDAQHKELFTRVEAFMKILRSSLCWEDKVQKVNETLAFMRQYVVEHFNAEEAYQKSIGYPHYEAHKKIHADMVSYVLSMSAEYEKSGFDEQLIQRFGGKLLTWLINHVAAEDQRIAYFAIQKGGVKHD